MAAGHKMPNRVKEKTLQYLEIAFNFTLELYTFGKAASGASPNRTRTSH
jgi:hypothetical protein